MAVNETPEIQDGACVVCSEPLEFCLCLRCSECESLYPVTDDEIENEEPLCRACSQ